VDRNDSLVGFLVGVSAATLLTALTLLLLTLTLLANLSTTFFDLGLTRFGCGVSIVSLFTRPLFLLPSTCNVVGPCAANFFHGGLGGLD
jgi:hypothetical protein